MEGIVLFKDALNTFYLWLYNVGHNVMVKYHSDNERKSVSATSWATAGHDVKEITQNVLTSAPLDTMVKVKR